MNDLAAELRYRREQRLVEKSRRVGQTMAMDAKSATVVAQGGEWFYRKDGDALRYGPFKSATEAAQAARSSGLAVDEASTAASNGTPNMGRVIGKDAALKKYSISKLIYESLSVGMKMTNPETGKSQTVLEKGGSSSTGYWMKLG